METIITSETPTVPGLSWSPLRAVCRWYRQRQMAAALGELDDRMLKDIGVYRCAIPSIARRHGTGPGGY